MRLVVVALERLLDRLFGAAVQYPRSLLAVTLLTLVVSGVGVARLERAISVEDMLEEGLASTERLRELRTSFPAGPNLLLVFDRADGKALSGRELCRLRDELALRRNDTPGLEAVISTFDARTARWEGPRFLYPEIVQPDCTSEARIPIELGGTPWESVLTDRFGHSVVADWRFEKAQAAVDAGHAIARWRQFAQAQGLRLRVSGTAYHELSTLEALRRNNALNYAIFAFVFIALWIVFGSWKAPLLFCGTLIVSIIPVLGLMGWSGSRVNIFTSGLFLMLTVCSLEDYIFVAVARFRLGWQESFRASLVPSFLTSLTTVIGFWSLGVSELGVIRDFGLWAGLAAACEWASIFLVKPAVLALFPTLRAWTAARPPRVFALVEGLGNWELPVWARKLPLLAFPIAIAVGLFGQLEYRDDPARAFPPEHDFRRTQTDLLERFGWAGETSLLFDSDVDEKRQREVLASLNNDPLVARIESVWAVVSHLQGNLDPATRARVRDEYLAGRDHERFRSDDGTWKANLFLRSLDSQRVAELRTRVETECPRRECRLAGTLDAYSDFAEAVPRTLFESFASGFLAVAALIALVAWGTRPLDFAKILASVLWGPAVMLIIVVVLGLRINFMTCVFASVLLGLTGDNAIHYLHDEGNRGNGGSRDLLRAIREKSAASILCTIVMIGGTLVFNFSAFEPPRDFGWLLSTGLLLSLIGDLWLLKGLLKN